MDESNPAVRNQLALSPARLEEIATDKAEMLKLFRKFQVINALKIHQEVGKPNVPLAARINYAEQLNKAIAQTASELKEEKQGPGAIHSGERLGVVFNFINAPEQPKRIEVVEEVRPAIQETKDDAE